MKRSNNLQALLISGMVIFTIGLLFGCKKSGEGDSQQRNSVYRSNTEQEKTVNVGDVFICGVCGHIEFGSAPENCPVCQSPKDQYTQNNNIFKESEEQSTEAAAKHIPSITVNKECELIPEQSCVDVVVRIGETLHPMEESHYIQFIDCYVDNRYISRILLTPGVFAAGCFHLKAAGSKVRVVEFCNLHGYWLAEADL